MRFFPVDLFGRPPGDLDTVAFVKVQVGPAQRRRRGSPLDVRFFFCVGI